MNLLGPASKSVVLQLAKQVKFVLHLNTMATYEQVKDVPNHPEVYLIDVRRKDELQQTGSIPASLNIPCKINTFHLIFINTHLCIFLIKISG